MSTVTRRGRLFRFRETPAPEPARKRKRRRWRLAVGVLTLAGLVWLLPVVVAHSPVLDWLLATAAADLDGAVTVESASLGWVSPIAVEGIEVRDSQGNPVLEAARLEGDRRLASMLLNWSKLGQFRLEQPKLTVVLRKDGSNLEDMLAAYLDPAKESKRFDVELKIVDGSVSLTDQGSRRTWQIDKLQLSLSTAADATKPLKLDASGTLVDAQNPGRFSLGLSMRQQAPKDHPAAEVSPAGQTSGGDASASTGELKLEAGAVPLAMFQSLLGRFMPQTGLAGRLGCKIQAEWGADAAAGKTVVRADVTTDDLVLTAPPLGTDRVKLKNLHTICHVTRQGDRIEVKNSSLDCDLGEVSVSGALQLDEQGSDPMLFEILQQPLEISGRVDLARLARMLPETLRIRKETRITSGQVQLALVSRPDPRGMVWEGAIEASDLRAAVRGRQLAWQRPLSITLAAHDFHEGPVVESLKCESDFFKLHAAGTPDDLAASASFDLKQLAGELGQLVDLGRVGLGGDGWAHFNWKRAGNRDFEADAELQVRNFQLALPDRKPWTEENLLVFLSATGRTDFGVDTQLQAASLQLKAAADQIDARLTQPILEFRGGGTWPVELKMNGQLQRWPERLRTWFALDDWRLAGDYDLLAQASGSKDGVTIRRARLALKPLQLRTPSLNLDEPSVELAVAGKWNRRQQGMQLDPVTLTSNSLSVQANRIVLAMPAQGPPKLSGVAKYQANLQRLAQWIADPAAPPAWRIQGRLSGTAQLAQSAGLVNGQVDADVNNLLITLPSGKRFQEPVVHLAARGGYEHRAGMLRLEQLVLTSAALDANATGRIARADEQTNVQLGGQIKYDLERLTGLLQPHLGPGIRIVGSGTSPASYRGPLSLAKAQATAAVGWKSAEVYGFPVGPGELKANLAGGVVRVRPMDLAVSGGQMRLAPQIRLAPAPRELTMPHGPLAKQVQITPAMCDSALKYIAPVLAGVTAAQGAFSIELDGCRVPLADPAQGDVSGKFVVHSVEIGPGPLVRELAVLLGKAAPAKLRRESVVRFRMVEGRVHHAGLELVFPDLTIRTAGSVGLDQTLALMAEMPVPPKWLGNNPLGTALKGQTIQLPIGGTLTKPAINRRVLDQVSRQFLRNAARNVIEEEMGKQLERLFGPPQ